MADKYLTIGSHEDIIGYDDTEFNYAIDTDGNIRIGSLYLQGSPNISGTFSVVTDVRINGTQLQKRTRGITVKSGVIVDLGTTSIWTDTEDI